MSSFDKIKEILEFTAKANIPIVEENVREHIKFFKSLLDQLNEDLTQLILVQGNHQQGPVLEHILNALQFSFAMGFDDNGLWMKLYQAIQNEIS